MTDDTTTPDETAEPTATTTDDGADEFFGSAAKAAETEGENAGKDRNVWDYKKQAVLQGKVIKGDRFPTRTDKGYSIIIEVAEIGTDQVYTVWCSSKLLEDWIMSEAPAVGSLVYIEFLGKQPVQSDSSRKYNLFSVRAQVSDHPYWHKIHQAYHEKAKAKQEEAGSPAVVKTEFGPDQAPF